MIFWHNVKKFFTKRIALIGVLVVAYALVMVNVAYSFTEPLQPPPQGNVAAPLNTGGVTQFKTGALGVGGVLQSDSLLFISDPESRYEVNRYKYFGGIQHNGDRFNGNNYYAYMGLGALHNAGAAWNVFDVPNQFVDPTALVLGTNGQMHLLGRSVTSNGPVTLQERLTVTSAGNVGIGTSSPTDKLHVVGNVRWTGSLTGGEVPWARLTNFPADCPAGQFVNGIGSTLSCDVPVGGGGGGGGIGGSGTAGFVPKFIAATIIGNSQIFDNGTNVGIGTTSPIAKLSVAGSAVVNGSAVINGNMAANGTVSITRSLGTSIGLEVRGPGFSPHTALPWTNGWNYISGNGTIFRNASDKERMRIDATNGRVGINTSNPLAALHVEGQTILNGDRLYMPRSDAVNYFWIMSGPDEGGAPLTNINGDNVIGWNVTPGFDDRQVGILADTFIGSFDQPWSRKNLLVIGNITAAGTKSFQIDHPLDPEHKYLIHAAIEGPEAGVYYRGEGKLSNGRAVISLPDYFESLTRKEGRTVLLTPLFEGDEPISALAASPVKDGKFSVRAIDKENPSQAFYWEVKAIRSDVEPLEVERRK